MYMYINIQFLFNKYNLRIKLKQSDFRHTGFRQLNECITNITDTFDV